MLKIGILGASQIAPYGIIEPVSLRDDCEITVVGCRDLARGKLFAKQHNIADVETDYHALVQRDDIDLVYNALPPSRHADLSIAALEAGKPVLCEKPFAMNASEAIKMADAAIRTGLPLVEAFHYRFHPAFQRALEIIQAGEIGDITKMHAIFVAPVPYREGEVRHTLAIGGGSLMDMGCYPIHWSRMIMGEEPTVSEAKCITHQLNVDTTTTATLMFSHGRTSHIECSMDASREFQAELTVYGTKGELHFHNPLSPHNGHLITIKSGGSERTETVDGQSTYELQLAHMIDVITKKTTPMCGGNDAIANMKTIDAIYIAAGLTTR
jgi:predicted dehydrogenase